MRWITAPWALLLFLFACDSEPKVDWESFDLQGHRGCRGLMPENSIAGMKKALELGVKTLELDVVITADLQVVLSHEPHLSSQICLDAAGQPIHPEEQYAHTIYSMSLDELGRCDCGSKPNPAFPEQAHFPIAKPTLQEVIQSSDSHARSLGRTPPIYNIETKSTPHGDGRLHPRPDEFVHLVYKVVCEEKIRERCTIQSFDPRTLRSIHQLDPDIRTILLVDGHQDPLLPLEELDFLPYAISPEHTLVDESIISSARSKRVKLIPWTVNDSARACELIGWGVDGLITDYPDRINTAKHSENQPTHPNNIEHNRSDQSKKSRLPSSTQ